MDLLGQGTWMPWVLFCFVLGLGVKVGAWQLGNQMPFGQKGNKCDCKAVKQLRTKGKKAFGFAKTRWSSFPNLPCRNKCRDLQI